jgi:general secretion pathway protein F/type IV pilus assembly protein PilC
MPEFAYIARDLTGNRVEGTLAAGTEREVIASLSAKDLFPLKVASAERTTFAGRTPKVKARIMATTYNQLSALLRSGVPLLRSIEVIREQTPHKNLKIVLDDVYTRVQEGATLADAMAKHPRAFGELGTSIVRAGGEGGFLEEALERLARFTEQQDELKSRVMGALAYPAILFIVGTTVVTVLIVKFVPKFEKLFSRLRAKGELPAVTDWLLALSHFLQDYGLYVVAAVALLVLVARNKLMTEEGRVWLDRWRLKIPVVSSIYLSLAVSRFCRVLGTLLTGGVPIVRSLEISADSTGNRILSAAVREAAENISAGQALAQPLAESGHFPADVVEMIAVAEQANSLETVLPQIADSLERDTWRRLDLFVRLLEPLMLLLLAGVVLLVVIALLVPVLKMSAAI